MAHRYGKMPCEMKDLSLEDYQFNLFCLNQGIESQRRAEKKQGRKYTPRRGR